MTKSRLDVHLNMSPANKTVGTCGVIRFYAYLFARNVKNMSNNLYSIAGKLTPVVWTLEL